MTKEKAKEILISTLRDINSDDDGFEYTTEQFTEAMLIAIESLSNHSLPSNLEEAASKYISTYYANHHREPDMTSLFIAGAEWQREQDQSLIELAEDHAMLAGMNKMKEEMMEKAVEHYVIGEIAGHPVGPAIVHYDENLNIGDKVKVIVIPEEK